MTSSHLYVYYDWSLLDSSLFIVILCLEAKPSVQRDLKRLYFNSSKFKPTQKKKTRQRPWIKITKHGWLYFLWLIFCFLFFIYKHIYNTVSIPLSFGTDIFFLSISTFKSLYPILKLYLCTYLLMFMLSLLLFRLGIYRFYRVNTGNIFLENIF